MSIVHLRHIKRSLETEFRALVDMTDYLGKPKDKEEDAFLSRAQAAFSLVMTAKVSPTIAASSIVDSYDDNGIDAIYFDQDEKLLFLVQSKWHKAGKGSIESADIMKFVQGVRDLLEANFTRFNGIQALSKHAQRPLDDLLAEVNDASSMLSTVPLTQADLHKAVVAEAEGDSIKLEVMLSEWGQCKQPYSSYYGQVEAADIGAWWKDHQQALFAKNLRKFTGSTEVNEAIKETLT